MGLNRQWVDIFGGDKATAEKVYKAFEKAFVWCVRNVKHVRYDKLNPQTAKKWVDAFGGDAGKAAEAYQAFKAVDVDELPPKQLRSGFLHLEKMRIRQQNGIKNLMMI